MAPDVRPLSVTIAVQDHLRRARLAQAAWGQTSIRARLQIVRRLRIPDRCAGPGARRRCRLPPRAHPGRYAGDRGHPACRCLPLPGARGGAPAATTTPGAPRQAAMACGCGGGNPPGASGRDLDPRARQLSAVFARSSAAAGLGRW